MVSVPPQAAVEPFEEFVRDPVLTIACMLLIVVSIAWVVVVRKISRNLRDADRYGSASKKAASREPREVWKKPPS
jgi:hypothetical protein